MPVQAIEPRRLYRQIADQLAALIASGEYPPGGRLPAERELAERLGVSRPSVREALIALEVEGLVEVRGGSGIHVLRRLPKTGDRGRRSAAPGPFDVIRARGLIEAQVCALAARQADVRQLAAIGETVEAMGRCASHDPAWIALDRRFHMAIAAASGNAALELVVATLWSQRTDPLYLALEQHTNRHNTWARAVEEHRAIHAALARRQGREAARLMREHMANAQTRLASSTLGAGLGDARLPPPRPVRSRPRSYSRSTEPEKAPA